MLESLLSSLFFIALGMPVMIIVTESFRIVKNARFFLLANLYLILAANEVLFTSFGADFYYYHILIDCVLITLATSIYADHENPKLTYPRRFIAYHVVVGLGLLACTARFVAAPGEVNFIVGVNLVLVCFVNGWILFRSLEEGPYAFLAILSFWLLMHFGKYSQPDWINALLSLAFFGTIAVYTGVRLLTVNKKTFAENNLLIKARDVVLTMLNDISSSMNNLSSVDFTLNRVLETIVETLGVEGAAIYALDREMPETPILRFSQSSGLFWPMHAELDQVFTRQQFMKEHLEKTIYRVGEGLVGLVVQKKEMFRLERSHDADEMKHLGLNPRNIRNVLAVPLKVKEMILGVLVVQNRREEGVFNLNDTHLLQALADQAGLSINNVRMYAELAKTDRLRQEMNIASDMQRELLPTKIPSVENLKIAAYIRPAKEVGGDYYDFVENNDKSLGIVIGDVSGKGLPAGLIMVMAKTVLQIVARDQSDAKTIVSQFAREMYPKMHRGQFMTLNYLLWQPKTRTLHCAGAGHEHILWYHKEESRAIDKIRAGGMAVGLIEDPTALIKEHALVARPGDVFLLYTDGITEARNKKDELFTLSRLMTAFEQCAPLSNPDLIREKVIGTINEFSEGIDQYDDITLVVLSVVS